MNILIPLTPLLIILSSFHPIVPKPPVRSITVPLRWTDSLAGDFSFTRKWDYPGDISFNQEGQPVCNAFCPPQTETMTDRNGIIYSDSLDAYYALIDTAHLSHTISCNAWCYEWAGANYIDVFAADSDSVICITGTGAGTHCRLQLIITADSCIPTIELQSIATPGKKLFHCTEGSITIDRTDWKNDTLKARFSFAFHNSIEPGKPVFWNGKIKTAIRQNTTLTEVK